jgi:hypothetical protein
MNTKKGKAVKMLSKSKYKYVYIYRTDSGGLIYQAKVGLKQKMFYSEREAALFVDKALIEKEKEPINILIRKI